MNIKPLPDQKYLKEYFDYNPSTGILTIKERPRHHFSSYRNMRVFNARFAGTKSGFAVGRYLQANMEGKRYPCHRIIFKWLYGRDANGVVDHVNGDGTDNRQVNLREATASQNNRNCKSLKSQGMKGTFYDVHTRKWKAQISLEGVSVYLGSFETREEAHATYMATAKHHYGLFATDGTMSSVRDRIDTKIRIPYQGQLLTIKELSEQSGIPERKIRGKLSRGFPLDKVLEVKVNQLDQVVSTVRGNMVVRDALEFLGISMTAVKKTAGKSRAHWHTDIARRVAAKGENL